jgi:hypothetical protein
MAQGAAKYPTWVKLVHTVVWIDLVEGWAEVVRLRVGGGEDLLSGAGISASTTCVLARGGPKGPERQVCQPEEGPNCEPNADAPSCGESRAGALVRVLCPSMLDSRTPAPTRRGRRMLPTRRFGAKALIQRFE